MKSALDPNKSTITQVPLAESITRERTFTVGQLRDDFRDAQTQFLLLLTQLHEEKFTGQLSLHWNNGNVLAVKVSQTQKLQPG